MREGERETGTDCSEEDTNITDDGKTDRPLGQEMSAMQCHTRLTRRSKKRGGKGDELIRRDGEAKDPFTMVKQWPPLSVRYSCDDRKEVLPW